MAQWHNGPDGERWRLESVDQDEYIVISFPDKASAETGIAMRVSKGLVLLDKVNVGRVEARFLLPAMTTARA
jgi:hypothetical protein